jgi:Holliday junction resolvase
VEIRPEILDKHLADAAIEQLAEDYSKRGFEVARGVRLGDDQADLVARKGDDLRVFEIKSGSWSAEKRKAVQRLRNHAVQEQGGQFILVMVPPPRQKIVEVQGIKDILMEVVAERCQSELAGSRVAEIQDVDLRSLVAGADGMEVAGSAYAEIEVQAGPDTEPVEVPFEFRIELSPDLQPRKVLQLDLDLREITR